MINVESKVTRKLRKELGVVAGICDIDTEIILLNCNIHYI
jgi:hypothetical protein